MSFSAIRNIWAVGRNYRDHAKELGNAVPTSPMIFLKAGSSALESGRPLVLPEWSKDVQHEAELALRFGPGLKITEACIALDLTARDIQNELKKSAAPWTLAKSFKNSAPLGNFFPVSSLEDLSALPIRLILNSEMKQNGNTRDMVFQVPELIKFVIERFPVEPGDLLLTGTPAGVSPLKPGDRVSAEIPTLSRGEWTVSRA